MGECDLCPKNRFEPLSPPRLQELAVAAITFKTSRIARLLAEIESRRLSNIRIFVDDARLLIAALRPASIDRVMSASLNATI